MGKTMRRYALYGGCSYYPGAGPTDLRAVSDDLDRLATLVAEHEPDAGTTWDPVDWWVFFDRATGKVLKHIGSAHGGLEMNYSVLDLDSGKPTNVQALFLAIDAKRKISEMTEALVGLKHTDRIAVVLHGLKHSKFQFVWSHFAKELLIPESEWPDRLGGGQ